MGLQRLELGHYRRGLPGRGMAGEGPPLMNIEEQILESISATLDKHLDHKWKQVGRCVYCHDCGERLYQGQLPADRREPKPKPVEPKATTDMRQRWRKD
jgi:hypothetical protein